jgi:hypothetical protein
MVQRFRRHRYSFRRRALAHGSRRGAVRRPGGHPTEAGDIDRGVNDELGPQGSRRISPNGGPGRYSAFVGVCPDVGKASVVLHAVANRTHRPVVDRLVDRALIEIPADRNHPEPAFRGAALLAFRGSHSGPFLPCGSASEGGKIRRSALLPSRRPGVVGKRR